MVHGRLAQVVKNIGDMVTLQVFSGTEGIPTNAEVVFYGEPPKLKVGDDLAGRFFDAYGRPLFGATKLKGSPSKSESFGKSSKRNNHRAYCNWYCRYRPN
jgi:vacuolar-type H+-ATPase subunit B/Vma2